MFSLINNKLISSIVLKYYFKAAEIASSFKDFASSSNRYLILLPQSEKDYVQSFEIIETLLAKKKKVSVFVRDFKVSQLSGKYRAEYIDYNAKDINKLSLPSKRLCQIMKEKVFDVVIDLNRDDNLFSGIISNLCRSKFRIGFKKGNSDKFYNIQLINNEPDSAISYRNLLNSLQMF